MQLIDAAPESQSNQGLLPPELEEKRLSTFAYTLDVKSDPRNPDNPEFKEYRRKHAEGESVRNTMLNRFDVHAVLDSPGRIALVRKRFPHALFDMMALSSEVSDSGIVASIAQYPASVRNSFFALMSNFGQFAELYGLNPFVCYTYDPLTNDRKSGQSIKTFHMHCNARTNEEIQKIKSERKPLKDYPNLVDRRSYIDEGAIVMSIVLADYLKKGGLKSLVPINPYTIDNCPNIRFYLGRKWESIDTENLDLDLLYLHSSMQEIYNSFLVQLTIGESGLWKRPLLKHRTLKDTTEFPWLSDKTLEFVEFFLGRLNPQLILDGLRFKNAKNKRFVSHVYPLGGLCYSVGINREEDGNIYLSLRPQMFSETGGAGLIYLRDTYVKLGRGNGTLTQEEIEDKEKFEEECAKFLYKNVN